MSLPGKKIEVNGLNLHVVDEGSGPAVLLLHGFPDSSSLWRHLIPVLLEEGFRVIAPDMRGFGESDKPEEIEAYQFSELASDMVAVLQTLEIARAHVIGHDWGAVLGWVLAASCPGQVERFAALTVGHPNCFFDHQNLEQQRRSWYCHLFNWQGLAEEMLTRDDWSWLRHFTDNHPEFETWRRDLSRPGALTAALSIYRANVSPEQYVNPQLLPDIQAPTLGIWSDGDAYLTELQMTSSKQHVKGPWRYERFEGASHWFPLDQPERCNQLLLEFLSG